MQSCVTRLEYLGLIVWASTTNKLMTQRLHFHCFPIGNSHE